MNLNLTQVKDYQISPELIKAKYLKDYTEKVGEKHLIIKYLNDPKYKTITFDLGWVIFKIEGTNCIVVSYYRNKKSKMSKDDIWSGFKEMLRENGCKNITIYTTINPKMWEKRYGFKLSRYEMELEL